MTSEGDNPDAYNLQTLTRGAAVLDLLLRHDYLTLKETCTELGLNTTTVYRLLRTWAATGYLMFDAATKRYHPGPRLLRIASKAHTNAGLPLVEARLRALSTQVGQTASFSVLAGRHALYLARVVAAQALMYQVEVGKTLPAYATSAGHVLLAFQDDARLLELFPEPVLMGYTDTTPRSRDELLGRLAKVRADGYAFNQGQLSESISALAAPARDATGRVVGAFSIAGATAHFGSDDVYRRFLPLLLETARDPVELLTTNS